MVSEETIVITAAILALAAEVRMASQKESDLRSAAEIVEKSWEHFKAVLVVGYDLGESSRKRRQHKSTSRPQKIRRKLALERQPSRFSVKSG
jgi:hypothetical protein